MFRLAIALVVLLGACLGCGVTDPMKIPPHTLHDVDFDYDSTWDAAMGAVQIHFPYLEYCNKDDMRIVSYFRRESDADLTSPREWAKRAFLTIRPREAPEGTSYDIEVHVGKYWRARDPWKESEDGWDLVCWDEISEKKIIASFKKQTIFEQRIRQGHKKFDTHRSTGW